MLFPEPSVAEGPTNPMPVFLSGEKRQAVRTSKFIPPAKKVEKINGDCNRANLQNILYVLHSPRNMMKLIPSRSKYHVDLSRDLDDVAVSLLIEHGLGKRYPAACDAWKSRNAENKEATRKNILEEERYIDEKLQDEQPLLEDTLARGIARRILDAYPYVLPFQASPVKTSF